MNLILFGFKGAGKTHLGKQLSTELNRPFIDTDQLLELQHKCTVRELYRKLGELQFRKAESQIILSLKDDFSVIALGGGAVLLPENVVHLQRIGRLIFVDTPFAIIQARIMQSGPPAFLGTVHTLKEIYDERKRIYESIPAERMHGF